MLTTTTIDELDAARLRGRRIIDVCEPHEWRRAGRPVSLRSA